MGDSILVKVNTKNVVEDAERVDCADGVKPSNLITALECAIKTNNAPLDPVVTEQSGVCVWELFAGFARIPRMFDVFFATLDHLNVWLQLYRYSYRQ